MAENFTGLSYESQQLCDPFFFSSYNRILVNLFRTLGPQGVLRLGGSSSDLTSWQSPGEKNRARRAVPLQRRTNFRLRLKRSKTLPTF